MHGDKSLFAFFIAFIVLFVISFVYERSKFTVKEIALVVVLSSLAALCRIPFAIIPPLQPTTFLVILSGFVFGPTLGLLVGAFAAVISNMFLGQGPWTLWQMISWGLCGFLSGFLGIICPKGGKGTLAVFGFIWGFVFGWLINLFYWYAFVSPHSLKTLISVNVASFFFDMLHACGNVVFALLFGGDVLKILKRFHRKLIVTYVKEQAT